MKESSLSKCLNILIHASQYSFRRGHSALDCIASVFEKRKNAIENKKIFAALLTDLSDASF